jgi:hypothetical protein
MKPVTGQYECQHTSGVGLDYFTSRVDRLTIQPDGRFVLVIQDRSRLSSAAQSLVSGKQVNMTATETRREGSYTLQEGVLHLRFDDGSQLQGRLSWNGEGLQIEEDFFTKVSDSTLLPPTHRIKKDMDDIAKGLKIASTIGGIAFKAAKTIHETIQSTQSTPGTEPSQGASPASQQPAPVPSSPKQPLQSVPPAAPPAPPASPPTPPAPPHQPAQGQMEAIFCDQCGARCRPGKRFCNNCGASLF